MNLEKNHAKRVLTQKRILDSAFELFTKKSLESCSIREIILNSGISQGNFYNYFKTKEEVFDCIAEQIIEKMRIKANTARQNTTELSEMAYQGFYSSFSLVEKKPKIAILLVKNFNRLRFLSTKKNTQFALLVRDIAKDIDRIKKTQKLKKFSSQSMALLMISIGLEVINESKLNKKKFNAKKSADFVSHFFKGWET